MSEEDIALVRNLYELMSSRGDAGPEPVDRVLGDYADDSFEVRLPADYPEGEQVHRGREGIQALVAAFRDTWSEWWFVPERFLDADGCMLVIARLFAVGHESGVRIERETNHVWTIRDGRATSMRVYRDHSEALKAVGLLE